MSETHWWYLFHKKSEELRLYNLVLNLTISNLGLKTVSSNAPPGWTVCFLGVMTRFLTERVNIYLLEPMSPLNSPTYFCLHKFTSIVCYGIYKVVQRPITKILLSTYRKRDLCCITIFIDAQNKKKKNFKPFCFLNSTYTQITHEAQRLWTLFALAIFFFFSLCWKASPALGQCSECPPWRTATAGWTRTARTTKQWRTSSPTLPDTSTAAVSPLTTPKRTPSV